MYREKKKRKRTASNPSVEQPSWKIAGKGLVFAWILTLVLILFTTVFIYYEWMSAERIPIAAKGSMILSMITGGGYVFKNTKGNQRVWVLIMLIGYLLIRFLLGLCLTFV